MKNSLGTATAVLALTALVSAQSYVPQRVFDTRANTFIDFETMVADLAKRQVVFVGEQHDDPNTHRLELAVLEGLARRQKSVIVSLEMFERDTQEHVSKFLDGAIDEPTLLRDARPWPRYATDYRPLVEFARGQKWPVIAANVPRPIASEVSKAGWVALTGKTDLEQTWFAADRQCPTDDEYFKKFGQAMGTHPAEGQSAEAAAQMAERFYFAQCLKDETMAESIARAHAVEKDPAPIVVHYNGAFHSDYGLGTAARVKRRLPNARIAIVTVIPVKNLDDLSVTDDQRARGDFVVFTIGK
ncbi:MAG TPA: ChaN family lipoprotein [Vicinamibacterales bacterium]|nr:ChaN family lipoprotein [Vicinamibacterales bacterium]